LAGVGSPGRYFDWSAIATTLRDAFIGFARVDHSIDEPDADTNDHAEEDQQNDVVAPALAFGLVVRRPGFCVHLGYEFLEVFGRHASPLMWRRISQERVSLTLRSRSKNANIPKASIPQGEILRGNAVNECRQSKWSNQCQ
jgi:hypothetical protein